MCFYVSLLNIFYYLSPFSGADGMDAFPEDPSSVLNTILSWSQPPVTPASGNLNVCESYPMNLLLLCALLLCFPTSAT